MVTSIMFPIDYVSHRSAEKANKSIGIFIVHTVRTFRITTNDLIYSLKRLPPVKSYYVHFLPHPTPY